MSKYSDYFNIDPKYFSQVNDASIRAGVDWTAFYPHETFVKLLGNVEKVLARQEKKSIWIEGSYGTGKSHAAWALKNILEVKDEDLKAYFGRHNLRQDLLTKLLGHKKGKIVTAHRYASASIRSDRHLILAVQESVRKGLEEAKVAYKGENTLKESVIAWIADETHKAFLDSLLKKDEYRHAFLEKSADDVLKQLRDGGDVHELMEKIFVLADKEGITALNIDMDRLIAWLTDVIDANGLKAVVLVWDEFSEYFKQNSHALTEFQKLAELCADKPFYLVIVTHESGSLFHEQNTDWKKLRDRFLRSEIALPENIAFDLIANALVKKESAKQEWESKADELNSRMCESQRAVANATGVKEEVLRAMLPLHPMASLLLKNISSAFASNQRSMFDFIKSAGNDDVRAFQWFIREYGPLDDQPLLTIDMLWPFFYEKGRDNLSAEISAVLDTYPRHERQLAQNEQRVLKTVLMMQAMTQKLGASVEIFKTTDANLNLAFEGTELEANMAVSIGKKLVRDEILFNKPIGGGKTILAAVTTAGDQAQIESDKEWFRKNTKTPQLVATGELAGVLPLTPALKLRYDVMAVTVDDFTRYVNVMMSKPKTWQTRAIIGFAKDDAERDALRKLIKNAVAEEKYKKLLFIDATAVPLGHEDFEQYVDYIANGKYYRGKDNHLADDMEAKGKGVLTNWRNTLYSGRFIVYAFGNQSGSVAAHGQAVLNELMNAALMEYPQGFDAAQVTETMFSPSNLKIGAECGIKQVTKGAFGRVEKVVVAAWQCDDYWTNHPVLAISKIKVAVDGQIKTAFEQNGRISIRELFDMLSETPYGFMPCNLFAFLMGFLLKEYAKETYRYSDGDVNEALGADKLKDMIDDCIKLKTTPNARYKDKYIVLMTPEEREFCRLTERTFSIPQNQCSSVEATVRLIRVKMKDLGFPLWCLKEIDEQGVSDFIDKFTELVNPGNERGAGQLAIELGKMSLARTSAGDVLSTLVRKENCQRGMKVFLKQFENGEVMRLAKEIGAEEEVLGDVRKRFDATEALWLWDRQTGETRIRDLLLDYAIVSRSNAFNAKTRSLKECFGEWRNRLTFVKISWDALKTYLPELSKLLEMLNEIAQNGELAPEKRQAIYELLGANSETIKMLLSDPMKAFKIVYSPYLDGLSDVEITDVAGSLQNGMFVREKTVCNQWVDEKVSELKKAQAKTKLRKLWVDKTGSKSPKEWSVTYKTPILCMVPTTEFENAKRAFDALNRTNPEENEIKFAGEFLAKTPFLNLLGDKTKRDESFQKNVMGEYAAMLPPIDEVRNLLEERLSVESYDWFPNPEVIRKLKAEAEKHYNAGGSDKVIEKIDKMDNTKLRAYLKRLIKDNIKVGLEIISDGGE